MRDQTGLLSDLFRFPKPSGLERTDLPRKHFACLTVLMVKKDFCKVRKVTGWE